MEEILENPKRFFFYLVPKCIMNGQSTDGECVVQASSHCNPMEGYWDLMKLK